MFCKICGGAIDPDVESINGTHAGMDYCVVILNARVNHEQARAEAAETTLRTIRWHMEPHDPRMATEEDIVNLLREFAQVTEAMYEAQEKAEAAESALAVSQAEARGMNALYDASVKVNETLSKRVAELEARLADEWRPVTGKVPRLNEKILLITDYTEPSISLVHRERHADHNGDVWRQYNGGLFKLNIPERALWRPLPPPPAATGE